METWMASGSDGQARVGRGGKVRSETITVRLDPKLRYLAELGARKQRRTLSSYVEWAIEASLDRVNLSEAGAWNDSSPAISISDVASSLWDVEEPDRFVRLALRYPELLTHHEQVVWKLIRENGILWKGRYDKITEKWTWEVKEESVVFEQLRSYWDQFNRVARGELEKSALPKWQTDKPGSEKPTDTPPPPDDEDIPF